MSQYGTSMAAQRRCAVARNTSSGLRLETKARPDSVTRHGAPVVGGQVVVQGGVGYRPRGELGQTLEELQMRETAGAWSSSRTSPICSPSATRGSCRPLR